MTNMIKRGSLKISGNSSEVLSVNLYDILSCIKNDEKCNWSILWIEAVGEKSDNYVLQFEKEINDSDEILVLNSYDLLNLSKRFSQIIEILLIGDGDVDKLKRYPSDAEMYINCRYTIELIDSSYWIVNSYDHNFLNCIQKKLDGVQEIIND